MEQHAAAAFRYNDDPLIRFDNCGDTVITTADAAMQGLDHLPVAVELRYQSIRSWRCPRFLDPERPETADLKGLEAIFSARKRGRYPIGLRNSPHHLEAEIILAQNEFHQMGARGEKA